MKSHTFKEFLDISDNGGKDEFVPEENERKVRLLKRRLRAFVREETDRKAHLLSNLLIEMRNSFEHNSLCEWLDERYEGEKHNIVFTFLDDILEKDIDLHEGSELAKGAIDSLRERGLLDT